MTSEVENGPRGGGGIQVEGRKVEKFNGSAAGVSAPEYLYTILLGVDGIYIYFYSQ